MSGHKPWHELSTKLRSDPKRRAHIEQLERTIEAELTITEKPNITNDRKN